MPQVEIQEQSSFDVAVRRFKRMCEKAGIPSKLREMEFYEKPTTKRKRQKAAAVKRHAKKLQKEQESRETNTQQLLASLLLQTHRVTFAMHQFTGAEVGYELIEMLVIRQNIPQKS